MPVMVTKDGPVLPYAAPDRDLDRVATHGSAGNDMLDGGLAAIASTDAAAMTSSSAMPRPTS